jgi:hypothetical protein
MRVWFVRSNAVPIHNDPVNHPDDYVAGEPNVKSEESYLGFCLDQGYARIGWPNTGPLQPGWDSERYPDSKREAANGGTFESIRRDHQRYLIDFASIKTGDLILTPSDTDVDFVHLGMVVRRDRPTREILSIRRSEDAYYYYHAIPGDQPYECSHRVDVLWDRESFGSYGIHHIRGLNWRSAFSRVITARDTAIEIARSVGLPVTDS